MIYFRLTSLVQVFIWANFGGTFELPGRLARFSNGLTGFDKIMTIVDMEFLEREPQLQVLKSALSEARAGTGRIALVNGEAGIGKSTLVSQFTNSYRNAVRVLWGGCDPLFTPRPLGPLHDIAPQMGGSFPALLSSAAPPNSIFSAVLEEFQRRPAIVVVEDVHWADEATLDLLRFLGRRAAQTSALLVLTYRDDELSPRHPLRTLLGDFAASPAARRLPLPPLSEQAVRSMIGDTGVDPTALYQQTRGNPFYVTEVLANPDASLPATIRDVVLARAAKLSASGHAVLEAAAVIGERVPLWLLEQVTGAEAPAAEECMAIGMLYAHETELAFRHELARQAIYEMISPSRRQVLHRLVLDALITSPATRQDLARLTHHAEAARDRGAILAYAPAAASVASGAGAHREAASLYKLAIEQADDLPLPERAALFEEYSIECDVIDERPTAISARRQAADLWQQAGDLLKYGDSLGKLALLLHLVGEGEEAAKVNKTAINALKPLPPNLELVTVYNSQAVLFLAKQENEEGVKLAENAIKLIHQLDNLDKLPRLVETLGLCWLHLDHARGIEHLERSLDLAIEYGQSMRIANSYANLSSVYVEFFQLARAKQFIASALAYVAERDLKFARMYITAWQAQLYLLQGHWQKAEEAAGEVLQSPETSIGSRGPALMALGRLRARRGDREADSALAESLELLFSLGFGQREGLVRTALAEAAWLAGDPETTLKEARVVYDRALRQHHPWVAGELAYWRWKCGERVELLEWMAQPYILQIRGDWQAAADAWEALGCPYEQARALALGDVEAQAAALQMFEQLGARPAADEARRKLQAAGVRSIPRGPRQATLENPYQLTNRQMQVLALLTENLTNAEIAARLVISPKTAGHHVSAVLARLNVKSREQAAELARKNPALNPQK
jgi:DNA-binding CsgD family transcriptional regulator